MYLLPAIDLKNGECVRLERGDMDKATVFSSHPAERAKSFARQGAEWIHVVDLDGAFAGHPVNVDAVEDILKAVDVKIELGGGIRSVESVRKWLDKGVSRVILGTAALRDPDFVKKACDLFPNRIAVGIDARDGKVAVEGWAETSEITDVELARRFEDVGVEAIVYTDISRDGVLLGPNLEATAAVAQSTSVPVIVSGGVSSLDDIRACRALAEKNVAGVIAGRAIYDGRFTAAEAIAVLKG